MNISSVTSNQPLKGLSPTASGATPGQSISNFSDFLSEAMQKVDASQQASSEMTKQIASGNVQNLAQAMIIKEQSGIALDLTLQVRNKAVEAYQEIMRMSI